MILDDLFNKAQAEPQGSNVSVDCAITTNQTGGLEGTGNNSGAQKAVSLTYVAGGKPIRIPRRGGPNTTAATFTGSSITIIAEDLPGGRSYTVEAMGGAFLASVDDATNIVYGAAGSTFITMSLCHYVPNLPR
jgi:hypothetical protein